MKKISLIYAVLFSILGISAQNVQPNAGGYISFHAYLQQHPSGIQKNSGVSRDIMVYKEIAFLHDTYLSNPGAWIYSDSGTYNYNYTSRVTSGNIVTSVNVNSAWADSTQFSNIYDASGYLLLSTTGEIWNS